MNEVWKVYKETVYNRRKRVYELSNFGRVKINNVITEPHTYSGYKGIGGFSVHRAVAELFIPNPDSKPCIDHIDTNKANNHVDNLRWVTHKENNNNPLTKQHMSEGSKGRTLSEETRRKLSEANKGKNNPFYGKTPWNKGKKGIYTHTHETKQKMSEAAKKRENQPMKGKHHSEETRRKMSEAAKHRTFSEETKRKISESNKGEKNPMYGKHHYEETRRKISESLKRKQNV